MNNIKNIWYALAILTMPLTTFAQDTGLIINDSVCEFSTGKITMSCIPLFIGEIIQLIFGFFGAIFFIMMLWGAYEYAFSGVLGTGEEGKKRIRNAIVGLIICICSFAILDFILTDGFGANNI